MRLHLGLAFLATVLPACGSSSSSDGAPANGSKDGGGSMQSGSDSGGTGPESDANSPTGDDGTVDSDSSLIGPPDAGAVDYDQVAPTPPSDWVNVTNNLTGLASECGNTSVVFTDPRADRLIVGIALNGLFASTNGGTTWASLGTTGDPIKNRMSTILFDPTNANTFWESGIYAFETMTPGTYITTNNGVSFKGYTNLENLSGYADTNDSISVDFTDPDRKTLLAGSHEGIGQLFVSTDTGTTWTNIGTKLPSGIGFCTSTLVLDSMTFIAGCANSYGTQVGGIVRSTNGGTSFTNVSSTAVIGQPLWASDGTIYFAAEGGGIVKSTDEGKTWSIAADKNSAGPVPPIELPDGRIVSATQSNVVITADKGAHWTTIGSATPYPPEGLAYSPFRRAFYISYLTCTGSNAVPANAITRYGWDYEAADASP